MPTNTELSRFSISEAKMREIKAYLRNGTLPNVGQNSQYRFRRMCQQFELGTNGKVMKNGKEVVSSENAGIVLRNLFYSTGSNSLNSLWEQANAKYEGISRQQIEDFLQRQES